MGEVALSFEEGNNGVAAAEEGNKRTNNGGDFSADASSSAAAAAASAAWDDGAPVVRWESFLPKMVLRVLLVEADDSTRQIIAALLRKCSYRVAAVSDGLKAWEVLKGRPHNIDLILTEVELPAISGFALLTLIMEHEICKNIPVIMMSSQDSVSTVYKCMLRGAADFLVKPVRKNELRNLWQHVWRRQASSSGGGVGPQDESTAQHNKVEATAENNAISNNSCDMACIQKNREYLEKGSDAQSSCTKPELDAERADTECVQDLSHSKWSKLHLNDLDSKEQESHPVLNQRVQASDYEADGSREAIGVDAQRMTSVDDKNSGAHWDFGRATGLGHENNYVKNDSVREVIDLIGAFDNYLKCSHRHSCSNVVAASKADSLPQLDLSLRRHPSGSVNQVTDERQQHRLNHSDASAFSRYVNKTLQPQQSPSPTSCNQQRDHSSHLAITQPGESECTTPRPQQRLLPAPVPVRGVRLDNHSNGFNPLMPQLFRTQSGLSAMQSSGSVNHPEAASPSLQVNGNVNAFYQLNHHQAGRSSQQYHGLMMQNPNDIADQNESHEGHKLEIVEDPGHVSSATDQSGNSSFCNGTVNHLHNLQCGASNNDVKADAVVPFMSTTTTAECGGNEESFRAHHDGNSIKSMQREAALTKFRLKRKERCFEKKVRYESRKKLAEKRPRVKGQFVRQVVAESPPGNTPPAG